MDYNYWKNCVKVYITKEKQDQLKNTADQRQSEMWESPYLLILKTSYICSSY